MKPLSARDLTKSDALKLFELGYAAGDCKDTTEIQKLFIAVCEVFPVESIVSGVGAMAKGSALSKIWSTPTLPPFEISEVICDANYPQEFLRYYINNGVLKRDGQFYLCLRTQKPLLWSDLYQIYGQPFDPRTKCGFDPDFATMLFDYNLHHVLRFAPIDIGQRVTNFSFAFRNRREAGQFSGLLETVVPYMHLALIRVYGLMDDKPLHVIPQELTLRQREILRWLIEGKTDWEIGEILHIAERSVKFHVQNLMRKFEAMNRYQLIANVFQRQKSHQIH